MIAISLYDDRGQIVITKTVAAITPETTAPTGRYIEGVFDPDVWMVEGGKAVPRPKNLTNVTGTTLFNIAMPATVRVNDGFNLTYHEVTDSTVELDFKVPGEYLVTVVTFPQVNAQFRFNIA